MTAALTGALALLVFAALWLPAQDWAGLLPKRAARALAAASATSCSSRAGPVPDAFRAGFERFARHMTSQVATQVQDALDRLLPAPGTANRHAHAPGG